MKKNFLKSLHPLNTQILILLNNYYAQIISVLKYFVIHLTRIKSIHTSLSNLTKIITYAKENLKGEFLNNNFSITIEKNHLKILKKLFLNLGKENVCKLIKELKLGFQIIIQGIYLN